MARVLPYVQSPLEQLMPYIGQLGEGVQAIGKKVASNRAAQQLQELENPIVQPNGDQNSDQAQQQAQQQSNELSPSELIRRSKLAEKAHGPGADKAYLDAKLQQQKFLQQQAFDIQAEERKALAEQKKNIQEKTERQGNIQKSFNFASSLLAKNTPGVGISPGAAIGYNRKAVEGRSTFNTLKGKFESILLPMVNKGTLAKERFDFILSQIPDASDSQREIAGKLRGLAETLSEEGFPIDTKILDSIPWISEDLKNVGKEERPPIESFFR